MYIRLTYYVYTQHTYTYYVCMMLYQTHTVFYARLRVQYIIDIASTHYILFGM